MRTFAKSDKLHGVCYDVRGPVLDAANEMKRQGTEILQLNIGNPAPFGFQAPSWILDAIRDALDDPMSQGYSESNGIVEAREAILDYHRSKGLPNLQMNHIYIGNGVSEMISLAMQGLLNDGDEILIPAPDYPLWTAAAKLAGGTPVHYICDEKSNWYPDIADMEKKINSRTKGIVIINPNNPTGALYPKEVLEQIVELARRHELILFADEIYDRLVFDGKTHTSIASLAPDLFVVTFNGLSKSDRIAGFRSGWMVLSGDLSKGKGYIEGINMLSSMRLCANVLAQHVVAPALKNRPDVDPLLLPGGRLYEQRKCICEAIDGVDGLSVVHPEAAFYIFPRIDAKRFGIQNDEQFVLDFLREKHVLLVHGGGFNWANPDHFRIVYLPEVSVLTESMKKMDEFLEKYGASENPPEGKDDIETVLDVEYEFRNVGNSDGYLLLIQYMIAGPYYSLIFDSTLWSVCTPTGEGQLATALQEDTTYSFHVPYIFAGGFSKDLEGEKLAAVVSRIPVKKMIEFTL